MAYLNFHVKCMHVTGGVMMCFILLLYFSARVLFKQKTGVKFVLLSKAFFQGDFVKVSDIYFLHNHCCLQFGFWLLLFCSPFFEKWSCQTDWKLCCLRSGFFLMRCRDSMRVPRIRENCHRVPRIREIGSLQIHTGHLTFSLKKNLLKIINI